jgi:hypothetical protein
MNRLIIISFILIAGTCSSGLLQNRNKAEDKKALLSLNNNGKGPEITVDLTRGKSFYYPLFAIWLEDYEGNYIQTLYVSKSVATGVFKYGEQKNNKWLTAYKRAPQTLPYWAHKRGIKASDGLFMPDPGTPVPDAYTGATPITGFILTARADNKLPARYKVMLEINQNWDWNEYWTNNKYPDDENYKMSCQPALVYEVMIDRTKPEDLYRMKPVGHSHYSGKTGELFPDLNTLTTALEIADSIIVRIKPEV